MSALLVSDLKIMGVLNPVPYIFYMEILNPFSDIGLPKIAASASKNQYLAVTDSEGVLMVLLLPRFYARPLPNEEHAIIELMSREDNRMNSWDKEHESRAEKIHSVNYNWQQSRILVRFLNFPLNNNKNLDLNYILLLENG